jgi:hypothetical protein
MHACVCISWLQLVGNRLTGTLPGAWGAAATALRQLRLAGNNLSGPIFPPAWLQPGRLPSFEVLDLAGNAGLVGSLPANLSWPSLRSL